MKEPDTLCTKTHRLLRKAVAGTLGATLAALPLVPAAMALDYADSPAALSAAENTAQNTETSGSSQTQPVEYKGMQLVEKFKKTGVLTLEEIKQIDLTALKAADAATYTKLMAYKTQLEAEAAKPIEPVPPTDPAEPENPDQPAQPADPAESETPDPSDTADQDGQDTDSSDTENGEGEEEGGESAEPAEDASKSEEVPGAPEVKKDAPSSQTEALAVLTPLPEILDDTLPESQNPFDLSGSYPEWSYSGDVSFEMHHYTDDLTSEKFIAVIGDQARSAGSAYGVSPRALIAYAVYASESGQTELSKAPYRNLFGLDCESDSDSQTGSFASYGTYKECFQDLAQRISAMRAEGADQSDVSAMSDEEYTEYMDGLYAADMAAITEIFGLDAEDAAVVDGIASNYELERFDADAGYALAQPIYLTGTDEAGQPVTYQMDLTDLVANVTSHLGVPYLWGGTTTSGFDCSGLVQYSYSHALGIGIPRTTYYQCTQGRDVDFSDLHAGDLVFFQKKGVVGHVGMYLGDGYYIEAPKPGSEVKVTSLEEKTPSFAKRLLLTVSTE